MLLIVLLFLGSVFLVYLRLPIDDNKATTNPIPTTLPPDTPAPNPTPTNTTGLVFYTKNGGINTIAITAFEIL